MVAYYMDVHIQRAVTEGLRLRGTDVLTTQEDGTGTLSDPDLLDRATTLGRALFTFDDLPVETTRRQVAGIAFAGVIFAQPTRISIGACVRDLEALASEKTPDSLRNRVVYLSL